MTIGERLRIAREQSGLSQGQVARLLEVHRPTISQIEADRRRVTAVEVARFSELYDVSVAWLAGADSDSEELDDRVRLAARELAKLKPNDLDRVLRLLSSIRSPKARRR